MGHQSFPLFIFPFKLPLLCIHVMSQSRDNVCLKCQSKDNIWGWWCRYDKVGSKVVGTDGSPNGIRLCPGQSDVFSGSYRKHQREERVLTAGTWGPGDLAGSPGSGGKVGTQVREEADGSPPTAAFPWEFSPRQMMWQPLTSSDRKTALQDLANT